MSRWISPWAWAAARPSAICRPMRSTSGDLERPGPVELLLQGLAGDVLHDQVGDRLLLDGVDADDVLVADGGGGAGLAEEPLARRRGGGQLRGHHLDGDHAVQLLVERLARRCRSRPGRGPRAPRSAPSRPSEPGFSDGWRKSRGSSSSSPSAAVPARPGSTARCVRGPGRAASPDGRRSVRPPRRAPERRPLQEATGALVGLQEGLDPSTQDRVPCAGRLEVGPPAGVVLDRRAALKMVSLVHRRSPKCPGRRSGLTINA